MAGLRTDCRAKHAALSSTPRVLSPHVPACRLRRAAPYAPSRPVKLPRRVTCLPERGRWVRPHVPLGVEARPGPPSLTPRMWGEPPRRFSGHAVLRRVYGGEGLAERPSVPLISGDGCSQSPRSADTAHPFGRLFVGPPFAQLYTSPALAAAGASTIAHDQVEARHCGRPLRQPVVELDTDPSGCGCRHIEVQHPKVLRDS